MIEAGNLYCLEFCQIFQGPLNCFDCVLLKCVFVVKGKGRFFWLACCDGRRYGGCVVVGFGELMEMVRRSLSRLWVSSWQRLKALSLWCVLISSWLLSTTSSITENHRKLEISSWLFIRICPYRRSFDIFHSLDCSCFRSDCWIIQFCLRELFQTPW